MVRKLNQNFIAIWCNVNFPNSKTFLTSGKRKSIAKIIVPFISDVEKASADILIGLTRNLTLKFLFAPTMNTTSKLSPLVLMGFVFPAVMKFPMGFIVPIVNPMSVNFVRNARNLAPKLGRFSIAMASVFTFANIA